MKRIFTLLFALLFSCITFTFGQGLQTEIGLNDDYQQEILQVANKNEFTYLIVRYDFNQVYLEKYDSLGTQLVKQEISPGLGFAAFQPQRMIITNDKNVWISGFGADACDVLHFREHVVVYDENCQFINAYSKNIGSTSNTQNYAALSSLSDTSVAVNYRNTDSSWIEILTPTTQTILANVNTPDLFGFGKNSQFHILGHSIYKIYGIDNQGVIQDSISAPSFFREIGTWNDTIIALGSNALYKITPDLQTLTTHPIPNLSAFTRLKIDAQGVRFISSNFNKGIHYLDHALNVQSLTTVPVFDPNNTIFDFDEFLTVAKNFQLSSYESIRMANYSLTTTQSTTVNRSDISVQAIQISDEYATLVAVGNVYTTDAKAMVLIKNNGPNVVDSVRLNHFVSNSVICGDIVTSAYFGNLNLAVGDSVWVDFGWLGEQTQSYSGDSLNREYCVYSSNPNGIIDLNITNDESCKTQFFGFLDLDDNEDFDFKLYPNPSSDFIHLVLSENNNTRFILVDQMGRIVKSGKTTPTISLQELQNGIYFLSLIDSTGKVSATKKIARN